MIEEALDHFKERYSHCRVKSEAIDITECFRESAKRFDAPLSYGDLNSNKVLAYAVLGAPLLEKYEKDSAGKLVFEGSKPRVRELDGYRKALSCLCLYDMRNTSLHEITDALQSVKKVQGFNAKHIAKIIEEVKKAHPGFDPKKDTTFMFAGEKSKVYRKIELNALWMSQLLKKGSAMTSTMRYREARLMEEVFPTRVLEGDWHEIERRSYMYGRELHTRESAEFLEKKVEAYKRYRQHAGLCSKLYQKARRLLEEKKDSLAVRGSADTIGNVSYCLLLGVAIDYSTSLSYRGITGSRATATGLNFLTGGLYGRWREFIYNKTGTHEKSRWAKKWAADLAAFIPFQIPLYAASLSIGSLIENGVVDSHTVAKGCRNLLIASPFIGPTMGLWLNMARRMVGARTPAQMASAEE